MCGSGGGTLTVFSAGDVGEEAEGLGLQVGGSPCPLSRLQHFFARIHSLIHWGSTVYNTLFNRQTTATTERAATVKHTLLSEQGLRFMRVYCLYGLAAKRSFCDMY